MAALSGGRHKCPQRKAEAEERAVQKKGVARAVASAGETGWVSLDGRTYRFHPRPGSGAHRSMVLATGSPETCSPRLRHERRPVLGGVLPLMYGQPPSTCFPGVWLGEAVLGWNLGSIF